VPYVPEPENTTLLNTALDIFRKFEKYPQALRLALQLNQPKLISQIFLECPDPILQKQLAFMLARQHFFLPVRFKLLGPVFESSYKIGIIGFG
jgi:26S proteasome regulatory subunit N1